MVGNTARQGATHNPIPELRPGLGGGVYTAAAFLLLRALDLRANNATRGGSIYWEATPGDLAPSLAGGLLQGSFRRISQCANLLDITAEDQFRLYRTVFNSSYQEPTQDKQCFS